VSEGVCVCVYLWSVCLCVCYSCCLTVSPLVWLLALVSVCQSVSLCVFVAIRGCLWLFLAVLGCLWLFVAVRGCLWLFCACLWLSAGVRCLLLLFAACGVSVVMICFHFLLGVFFVAFLCCFVWFCC
jgi:hypothetical protein